MARPTLSLVLPIYNEEEVIPELERRLIAFLATIGVTWEVVFVDDGSKDASLPLLRALAARDPRYKVVSFSRNFGHQVAITAGADFAHGEAVVVMDADLQDPPEVVREMIEKWRAGFDVVYAVRAKREGETAFKKLTAAAFYRLLRRLTGIDIPVDAGDFRLMSRRVVLAMRSLRELHRFIRGLVVWVGFKQTAVYYVRPGRFAGETKYPLRKMLRFAFDGVTSFSIIPLRAASILGVFAGCVSVALAVWAVWAKYIAHSSIPGWSSVLIAVSLGAAAQLLTIGVVGEYVGRIYEEVKRRPLYIVGERINAELDTDEGAPPGDPEEGPGGLRR